MLEGTDWVGNYGRFPYDETKKYMMLLKEMGVPVQAEEFGLMQEIQLGLLRKVIKIILNDGAFGDGFKIVGTGATNDFTITEGKLLLDGWLPELGAAVDYSAQPEVQSALTTPSGSDRTDEVYIDVWHDEIDHTEDSDILNPAIGVRTYCMWQMKWAVKVAENGTVPVDGVDGNNKYHWHYKLATLNRLDGNTLITTGMVVDERDHVTLNNNPQVEDWIVIDATEGDYATLVEWEADTPAANDRLLVKEDQTITAQFVLPDNVTIKFLDGARLLCATNIATSVLKLGSNPIIEGVLNIVLSQTGTTAKAVEIDGDNAVGKINVENSSTGTLTTAYHVNASKTGNKIDGLIANTGGGIVTNVAPVDNSTEDSNMLEIVDGTNNVVRRNRGARTFQESISFPVNWDFASQVGNDLNIATIGSPALTALNGTDVAFIDDTNEDLRTYRFDGTDWTQVGNDLNIAGIGSAALAALNGTDVAFIDSLNDDLRTYRFDGTDWTQVGNDLNIAGVGGLALTALNGTDVAFINSLNDDLRTYRFDGTDWTQVGNDSNVAGMGVPALAALNGTDMAFIDGTNDDLRLYKWGFSVNLPHFFN